MSFACIYVPDFPVQAALRLEGKETRDVPAAILDGPESLPRVFAANELARKMGIRIGMTRLQAEACGNALLRKRQVPQEESAQVALLDCGYGFSPRVESTGAGIVVVDLAGTVRLWGTEDKAGQELARRARACGFEAHVGIAANPDAAQCAAVGFQGVTVIISGEEAAALASLPIEVLHPDEEILEALDGWGIRSFQALAALPAVPVVERLGQEGLRLQLLAQGAVERELVPAEPPPSFAEQTELEEPVDLLEPLAFVLAPLLGQITARLQARSLGTDHVRLTLELEIHRDRQRAANTFVVPTEIFERSLKLPVPTQDSKLLLKLLRLELEAHPPHGPVKKVTIAADPALIRSTQTGLFQPSAPEPGSLEVALARLRSVVGETDEVGRSRVGSPIIVDSHRPDSFYVVPFRTDFPAKIQECLPSPQLALRRFRPPITARVELGDTPKVVSFGGRKSQVIRCAGPWRGRGHWWEVASKWQRDEWDVVLKTNEGFGLYRLVRDLGSGQWFVEGMYD